MDSPAIIILRWVQRQFPILKPPGVKDSFPLMLEPKAVLAPQIVSQRKNVSTLTHSNQTNGLQTKASLVAEHH